jgi:hypothetical protein
MKQIKFNHLCYALAVIICIVFLKIVYDFTANVPYDDDFVMQHFLIKFVQTDGFWEKVKLLIGNGLHRFLFMHLVILTVYATLGGLNYSAYILVSCLLLIGLAVLLICTIKNKKYKGLGAIAVAAVLFNGQNMGNCLWPMSGIANIGVCFTAFLTIWVILQNKYKEITPPVNKY